MRLKAIIGLMLLCWMLVGILPGAMAQQDNKDLAPLFEVSKQLVLGAPQTHQDLTLVPITLQEIKDKSDYECLDHALKDKKIQISEQGSGDVPQLALKNEAGQNVFILTGEIITGAKQDRMSRQDVLIPPYSKQLTLSVYCVEHGRWVSLGSNFSSGGTTGTKEVRQKAALKADQGTIWHKVAAKSSAAHVSSSTGTMQAVYNDSRIQEQITAYEKALADLPSRFPEMIGMVTVIKGEISSVDLFANPRLLADLWKKLLRAAAVDAVTWKEPAKSQPTAEQMRQFISNGLEGSFSPVPNPGLGKEFVIQGKEGVGGSTLINASTVIHLALFSPERNNGQRDLREELNFNQTGNRSYPSGTYNQMQQAAPQQRPAYNQPGSSALPSTQKPQKPTRGKTSNNESK